MSNRTLQSITALRPGLAPPVVEDKQAAPRRPVLSEARISGVAAPAVERRAISRQGGLRLVRMPEVKAICGLSRSSIYHLIQEGRFPAPVAIGGRARAWIKHEVEGWVAQRIRASRPHA